MATHARSFGVSLTVVLVGLAVLLGAEAVDASMAVAAGGGVVVLLGVGILTAVVAALPRPDEAGPEH